MLEFTYFLTSCASSTKSIFLHPFLHFYPLFPFSFDFIYHKICRIKSVEKVDGDPLFRPYICYEHAHALSIYLGKKVL